LTESQGAGHDQRMRYENVSVATVVHVDAPVRLTSAELMGRLGSTVERLGMRPTLLEDVAGIRERRVWGQKTEVAAAASLAGERALAVAGIPRDRIGLLISTSVSRDYIEPSIASVVHGSLGLSELCQNYDVGNACLAFINGMDLAANLIERGDIEYALIVDGEVSDQITDATVARLNRPETTAEQFRAEFASLTLGSGAVAMILGRGDALPDGHPYRGSVSRAATQFSHLCRGTMDRMVTDTSTLLAEGLKLAERTYEAAGAALGWAGVTLDEYVLHQVSQVHTDALLKLLGIDPARVLTTFGEYGNVGPAAVPLTLSKLAETGRLTRGARVGLLGIGSGLNCAMAEIVW
jgi:3-oxoacyl-[acyl-carrier-protein] synthase-3